MILSACKCRIASAEICLLLIWRAYQMSLILKCKMLLMMNKIFLGSFYKLPEAITNANGRDDTVAPWLLIGLCVGIQGSHWLSISDIC